MKDVMIDLETLGTRYDAMIISIGACYFNRDTGEIGQDFSVNINPQSLRDQFSIDYDTLKWWFKQSESARVLSMDNPVDLKVALLGLYDFLNRDGITLWSHATFDMPILMHAFDVVGFNCPVPFRNMRDIRTLMDIAQYRSDTPRQGVHHHALDDARYQAQYVSEAFRKLASHGTP